MDRGKYVLGIDLGGTKIAAGLVDSGGEVSNYCLVPTGAADGVEAVINRIVLAAKQAMAGYGEKIDAVGVGFPGLADPRTGMTTAPPNLPGWGEVPLGAMLQTALALPVFVDNDANAAALGENLFGAGRGCQEVVYITVSTGIGGGIITSGRLMHGFGGGAGEVGHMILDPGGPACRCGGRGCWEALSSGTAIAREAQRRIQNGEHSRVTVLAGDGPIRAEHVFQAQAEGDALAMEVIDRAIQYLGLGVANLVNVLNPQRVIIGGGVARAGDPVFVPLRERVRQMAFGRAREVEILPAGLAHLSGVVGAATLAFAAGSNSQCL